MKKKKIHSLTGRINIHMMRKAFKSVKRNRGSAGVDKVSIEMFAANLDENLLSLMRALKDRSFTPKPTRRVYIPKDSSGKKTRPLGIPAVRDRVAQEVLRILLDPIFEPLFHEASFGFRLGRNCHQAIEAALYLHNAMGLYHVVDADVSGFFDNIPHHIIMQALAQEIADGNILTLVERFLRAGVMDNGQFLATRVGTPQGGVLSPLLANITLNHLDWALEEKGLHFVRYADDFLVLTKTRDQAESALVTIEKEITKLGLSLSKEKTKVTTYGKGYAFLGFDLSSRSRSMRDKSLKKFKDKVKGLTIRKHNFEPEKVIARLNRVIRGTANYFATHFSTHLYLFEQLDKWIRMRLRAMKFKKKLGTNNRRMKTLSFRKLGLLSLLDFATAKQCKLA